MPGVSGLLLLVLWMSFCCLLRSADNFPSKTVNGVNAALQESLRKAGLKVSPGNKQISKYERWKILSVRLGSKSQPSGISTYCDWVITFDGTFYGFVEKPRILFVEKHSMPRFLAVLPLIHNPFVLVCGGGDITLPRNVDLRYQPLKNFGPPDGGEGWKTLLQNQNVLHMFIENHDLNHTKVSTLPTGFPHNPDTNPGRMFNQINIKNKTHLLDRPILLLSTDRTRDGTSQFADRARYYNLCKASKFCTVADSLPGPNVTNMKFGAHRQALIHDAFLNNVAQSKFILCGHGGGIDPSPKAWESIIIGTIPIIEHSTLDDAYAQLPVVIIPNITLFLINETASTAAMGRWLQQLLPFYEEQNELRKEVLSRLTTDYWWDRIQNKYNQLIKGNGETSRNDSLSLKGDTNSTIFINEAIVNKTVTGQSSQKSITLSPNEILAAWRRRSLLGSER